MRITRLYNFVIYFFCLLTTIAISEWLNRPIFAQGNNQKDVESTVPQLIVQLRHSGIVESVAITSNGKYVVTGSDDGTTRLWDVLTGKLLVTYPGSGEIVESVAITPDGKYVVTGSDDKTAKLWDAATGKLLSTYVGHKRKVKAVAITPDGKYVVTGSEDQSVKLWDRITGKELRTFFLDSSSADSVAITSNGRFIVVGGNGDSTATLWDINKDEPLNTFSLDSGQVTSIAITSKSKYVVIGTDDGTAKLYDIETGDLLITFEGHSDRLTSVAITSDRKYVVTGSWDGTAKIWDAINGKALKTFRGHSRYVTSVSITPDGNRVVSGSEDQTFKIWDVNTGNEIKNNFTYPAIVTSVAMTPDGKFIATANSNQLIKIWSSTGQYLKTIIGHLSTISSMAITPDGSRIVTGSFDGTAKLWDVTKSREIVKFAGHSGYVKSVAITSDGKYVVTGSDDKTAKIWNAETGDLLITFEGHSDRLTSVAITSDRKYVVTGSWDGTAKIWDAINGKVLNTLPHPGAVFSVVITPDGRRVATGSFDGARVWDVASGKEIKVFLSNHLGYIRSVAITPDGKYVVTGSDDSTVKLWDTETEKLLTVFYGHLNIVNSVAITADSNLIVTSSHDATTRFWKGKTGKEICREIFLNDNTFIAITPDGRFDTSNLEEIKELCWIMPDDPLKPLPLEIYTRDYFEPDLLPRILSNKPFDPVRSLITLNRIQPQVKIVGVEREKENPDKVLVKVQITEGNEVSTREGKQFSIRSGVYDLRLYRDKQLVGEWPGTNSSLIGFNKTGNLDLDIAAWREQNKIDLDPSTGSRIITFHNIQLPQKDNIREVLFTAYAFNNDRVKSNTSEIWSYTLQDKKKTSKPKAYVITVGINANQSQNWNLNFAVPSAQCMQQLLSKKLSRDYEVVDIQLLAIINEEKVTLEQATKGNIIAVLDLLAGRDVSKELRQKVDKENKLKPATPDDTIILFISSHGYTDPLGNFYVVPFDTGMQNDITERVLNSSFQTSVDADVKKNTKLFLDYCISSSELTNLWNGIDAGEMVMILDSCSSEGVKGKEFKPGPLGNRGFGQLSYDKGMRILCAAQLNKSAKATLIIGRSLLSEEFNKISNSNPDETLAEWLQDVVILVPLLSKEIYSQEEDVQYPILFDYSKKK